MRGFEGDEVVSGDEVVFIVNGESDFWSSPLTLSLISTYAVYLLLYNG